MNVRTASRFGVSVVSAMMFVSLTGTTCGTNTTTPTITPHGSPNSTSGTSSGSSNTISNDGPALDAQDHVLGDSSATVTVIEYGDFQCPICGEFARNDFATIRANYIDTGKIRWVFRHFPLRSIHSRAEPAARASECASDQGDFFGYAELLYANVDASGDQILTDAQLQQNAVADSLNATQFNACYPPADAKAARVQQDVTSGTNLGVTGTPTFFVGAERIVGYQSASQLGAIIDRHLGE